MITEFKGEYRWLSNFHPCIIMYEGLEFQSVEAAYQAMKTLDPEIRKMFTTYDASTAKREGRKIKVRENWNAIKKSIMAELLLIKFQIPELRDKLLATGDEELVEGNWWNDTYWGVCNGVGENHLGKLLMATRLYLQTFEN